MLDNDISMIKGHEDLAYFTGPVEVCLDNASRPIISH